MKYCDLIETRSVCGAFFIFHCDKCMTYWFSTRWDEFPVLKYETFNEEIIFVHSKITINLLCDGVEKGNILVSFEKFMMNIVEFNRIT